MAEPEPSVAEPRPNPYEQRGVPDKLLELDENHPIVYITGNWHGNNLTQAQWNEVYPTIVGMLGGCELREGHGVGPGDRNTSCAEAVTALNHDFDATGLTAIELQDMNQPMDTVKHIEAMEWALNTLLRQKAVESRIRKIVGAVMTTAIVSKVQLSERLDTVGLAMMELPYSEVFNLVRRCLEAYRVLDLATKFGLQALGEEDHNPGKLVETRNYLACCAMIDMQVGPWVKRAQQHLDRLGLGGVEGLLMGEADLLPMSAILDPRGPPVAGDCGFAQLSCSVHASREISAIRRAIPGALGFVLDTGFAAASDRDIGSLAALVFASAQLAKTKGCPWQVAGGWYRTVWLTVGASLIRAFPLDEGLNLLKACGKCHSAQIMFPDLA